MVDRELGAIQEIQDTLGDKKALVLVSGGVDSSVCAALLNKAVGHERVVALHIDNGFMRLDESAKGMCLPANPGSLGMCPYNGQ